MLNKKDKRREVVMQRIECPACRRSAAFKQEHLDSLDLGEGCSIDECPHCNQKCCWIHKTIASDGRACQFSRDLAPQSSVTTTSAPLRPLITDVDYRDTNIEYRGTSHWPTLHPTTTTREQAVERLMIDEDEVQDLPSDTGQFYRPNLSFDAEIAPDPADVERLETLYQRLRVPPSTRLSQDELRDSRDSPEAVDDITDE